MNKEEKMLPQELHNKVKEGTSSKTANNVEANLEDNDIQAESSIIVGKGDPDLSPDAGKTLL
ncbi:hypothetical protein AA0X95_17705 [Bacillus sp. 1P10SD]|uniref:hypothetical protein n=1 Tax=Bacillus sp. 1P10SD TaxID=3132265 RepID=UPI0039A5A553